ncbi:MAG: nicotinate-nucleotide adenylyltransferase [Caulobacterales bacterium]
MTLPPAYPRMRIGLMGGSFDPAHYGHAHVARVAAKRLRLHRVWWLVSPQNPLKPKSSALATRLASARRAAPPGVTVTDLESQLHLRFTADTLAALHIRYPGVRFVWIMGEDNMAGFHRWRRWPAIFHACPIFIVSRPTAGAKARLGPAFQRFAAARRPAGDLVKRAPPAWACQPARYKAVSSTMLKQAQAGRP